MACSNQKQTVVVIFEHCHYKKLCNEGFFSFFICIEFLILALTSFCGAQGIYKFDCAASVLWVAFQFLFKSPKTVTLVGSMNYLDNSTHKLCC